MPELPDIVVYLKSLERLLSEKLLQKVIIKSPFVLRTFDPEIATIEGQLLKKFARVGKRIVWEFEDRFLVFHLMIAGRFHWRKPGAMPRSKMDLAAFQFEHGTMMFTEASKKKRASMHLVRNESSVHMFCRGGLEPLESTLAEFSERLRLENRTLKRALTDPRLFSGIGNAYSDEILLNARLSPLKRTRSLTDEEVCCLYESTVSQLNYWIELLTQQNGERFPEKVTAFRAEMKAHGKFNEACANCEDAGVETKIQRIVYAENECNYCPRCQTGGKLLADRSLSRLLKDDWPKTIEELEGEDT